MKHTEIKINGEPSGYIIYENGQIYSTKTNKFLKPLFTDPTDYAHVVLFHDGKHYQKYIHVLVAENFIPNPYNKIQVNHIDGNKQNNDISNLEWVTVSENIIHAFKTGLHKSKIGSESHLAKYTDEDIHNVCKLLEEGIMTLNDISRYTSVSFGIIYLIIKHVSWTNISCNYNVDNYYHDREVYSHDDYEKVFKMLSENKLSLYEISDISGVRYSSVNSIKRRIKNPRYNDLFDKYDISNYTLSGKVYKDITKDMIDRIHELYEKDIPVKYIKRTVSKEFNINEEKIRVYIRDKIIH